MHEQGDCKTVGKLLSGLQVLEHGDEHHHYHEDEHHHNHEAAGS